MSHRIVSIALVLALVLSFAGLVPSGQVSAQAAPTIALTGGAEPIAGERWYSLQTGYNIVTVKVTDEAKNVAKSLTRTYGTPAVTESIPYVLVGNGDSTDGGVTGTKTFALFHGPVRTTTASVRDIQTGSIYFPSSVSPGTSEASPGGVTLISAPPAAFAGQLTATSGTNLSDDLTATTFLALGTKTARVKVDWVRLGSSLGASGITVSGTVVDPKTLLTSAGSEDVLENAAASGGETTTKFFTGTVSVAVDVATPATPTVDSITFTETLTIAATYQYDIVDTIVDVPVTSSSASALGIGRKITLTETGANTSIFEGMITLTNDTSQTTQLYVASGDEITATHTPTTGSAISAKGWVDLTAPTLTLVEPASGSDTFNATPSFKVEIKDPAVRDTKKAGVKASTIRLNIAGPGEVTPITTPIVDGYLASWLQTTALGEGSKAWYVIATDEVGNAPKNTDTDADACVNNAVKGTSGNTWSVRIDLLAPSLLSAVTGNAYDKMTADACGSLTVIAEKTTASNTSVRVEIDRGTGASKLDDTTVSASDFEVAGQTPSAATVVYGTLVSTKNFVYLTVPAMLSDARPKVKLVGEIKDKAGNVVSTGTLDTSLDGLAPTLTVTPDVTLSKTKVTITVSSNETLSGPPAATVDGVTTGLGTPTSIAVNTWTIVYTVIAGEEDAKNLVVMGTDLATPANTATVTQTAAFTADAKAPTITVSPASGDTVYSLNPWISIGFNEAVTLTKATLGITGDPAADVKAGFGASADKKTWTYAATGLNPGSTYVITISATDAAGNALTDATSRFTAKEPPIVEVALKPGWNLISIPDALESPSASVVLKDLTTVDRVYSFDPAAGWTYSAYDKTKVAWTGTLAAIEAGKGYFVYSIGWAPLKVRLAPRTPETSLPPSYNLAKGWNLVGYTSITRGSDGLPSPSGDADAYFSGLKWTSAYSYDPSPAIGYQVIKPLGADTVMRGKGYWLYLTEAGALVP